MSYDEPIARLGRTCPVLGSLGPIGAGRSLAYFLGSDLMHQRGTGQRGDTSGYEER